MNFTLAAENDKADICTLWEECFSDDEPFLSFWFNHIYSPLSAFTAKENDDLCAALQVLPYKMMIGKKTFNAAYICGVGTRTELRGKKIGTQLMQFCECNLKKQGYDFVFLISEADGFYKSLGYAPVAWKSEYMIDNTEITPRLKAAPLTSDTAHELYTSFIKQFNSYIIRDKAETERIIRMYSIYDGAYAIYENNIPAAYILFDNDGDTVTVEEAAYTDTQGLQLICSYLRGLNKKILLRCSAFEKLHFPCICSKTRTVFAKSLNNFDITQLNGGYISPLI